MYKHGSLLALFLFLRHVYNSQGQERICESPHAVWNGNLYGTIPFFMCGFTVSVPEMPAKAYPHKRLDKRKPQKRGEKERWKEK